jgi:hypothetical protein
MYNEAGEIIGLALHLASGNNLWLKILDETATRLTR